MGATQIRGAQVLDTSLTDADVAAANKDGTTSTPSMRTLGTGAQQAAAGNHTHAHSTLTGLTSGDDHSQYAYLGGRSSGGGQNFYGGVNANDTIGLAGSTGINGAVILRDGVNFNGFNSSAASITADQNNYTLTGAEALSVIRLSPTADRTFTGIDSSIGHPQGRLYIIQNVGSFNITLVHESASSTSTNRFSLPNGQNLVVQQNASVILFYENTSQRWHALSESSQRAILAGLAGGQTLIGGTASGENLTLQSTSNSTRGAINITDGFILSGDISATLSNGSSNNDFAPTGFAGCSVLMLTPGGSTADLGGLAGGVDGKVVVLMNVSATNSFKIFNELGTSTAANRFWLPGGHNITMYSRDCVTIMYDATLSRWRLIGANQRFIYFSGQPGGQTVVGGVAAHDLLTLKGSSLTGGGCSFSDAIFIPSFGDLPVNNDLNDTNGGDYAVVFRVAPTASTYKITGITIGGWGFPDGRMLYLINVGSYPVTLSHNNGGSTAGNKFFCPGNEDFVLSPSCGVMLWYDASDQFWKFGTEASEKGDSCVNMAPQTSLLIKAGNVKNAASLPYTIPAGVVVTVEAGAVLRITP